MYERPKAYIIHVPLFTCHYMLEHALIAKGMMLAQTSCG